MPHFSTSLHELGYRWEKPGVVYAFKSTSIFPAFITLDSWIRKKETGCIYQHFSVKLMTPTHFKIKDTRREIPRKILTYVNVLKSSCFTFILNDNFCYDVKVTVKG
jgi:hypothetical protein